MTLHVHSSRPRHYPSRQLGFVAGFTVNGMSRGDLVNFLVSAGYGILAGILIAMAYSEGEPALEGAAAGVLVLGAAVAWLSAHKRLRLIADTPTALLRSAPQGYVELIGHCQPIPGASLLAYGRIPPCLWYQVTISERSEGLSRNRTSTRTERSDDTFLLEDGTGECVIDPDDAEVLSVHATSWRAGNCHYRARYLMSGDRLYALGDLRTLRASDDTFDRKGDLAVLLREWKLNKAALLAKFDADGDGHIDVQEWQAVVGAAEHEVDSRYRTMRLEPGYHIMSAPRLGRTYLLSNRDPDDLVRRFRRWSWFHLAVFVGSGGWGLTLLMAAVAP